MTADQASPLLSLLRRVRRYGGFVSSDGRDRGAAAVANRPRVADELLAAATAFLSLIARVANAGARSPFGAWFAKSHVRSAAAPMVG